MIGNHLRTLALALVAIGLVPIQSAAQEQAASASDPEVGILVGATYLFDEYDNATVIGIPGSVAGIGGPLYLSVPVGGRVSVRAEAAFLSVSGGGDSISIIDLGGYGQMMFGGGSTGPYVLAGGALLATIGDLGDDSEFVVGGGLGHLSRVGTGLVVRLEARYERFMNEGGRNAIQVLIGVGATIG